MLTRTAGSTARCSAIRAVLPAALRGAVLVAWSSLALAQGEAQNTPEVAITSAAPSSAVPTLEVILADTSVVVPIDLSTRHISLEVMIDGQGPFPFQLDTYASIDACIDDDLARQLKLVKTGTTLNSDGHTTSTKDIVRIDELRLGSASFRNLRTLVDDYDFLSTPDGRPVRGLLGFTLFRDLLLTVDYPGSRVLLTRGGLTPGAEHVIPYTSPTGSPDVTLRFGDHDLTVGIDTGSGSALMLMYEDTGDLLLDGELRKTGQARTVYSSFDVYGAKLAQPVQVAGQRITGLSASFSKQQRGRFCGFGLLQGFALSFDQRHKLVRLERQLGP